MAFLHEHIILPLSDLITGQTTYRGLQFLKHSDQWGSGEMRDFQNERFRQQIHIAAKHVPFYGKWFKNNGLAEEDFHTIDDLHLLPIVDKSTMRSQGLAQFSNHTKKSNSYFVCHSSGTTGEPFEYYVSKEAYSLNTATKLRTWFQAGYHLGDRYMKIASAPRLSWMKKIQDYANNCIHIPFISLDKSTLQSILVAIENTKPSIIRSHPNVLFYLAREREQGHYTHSPKIIMTTSSALTDAYRETIHNAFGCDIIDSYSCEGTPNTAETPLHDGYHISGEYGIIEVLNNNNEPVHNGIGRVVSTDLWNSATMFLRYDTHDVVEVRDDKIVRIIGRENEMLEAANGKRYTGQVVCDYFSYETHGILAYQMVQQRERLLIRIVPDYNFDDAMQNKLTTDWQHRTGQPIVVEKVGQIPIARNGKSLTIITE